MQPALEEKAGILPAGTSQAKLPNPSGLVCAFNHNGISATKEKGKALSSSPYSHCLHLKPASGLSILSHPAQGRDGLCFQQTRSPGEAGWA